MLPAIRAMRTDPFETLKDDAQRTTASASANRLRHGLIVAEIALAMILLAGAGLLVRTMIHLSRLQPGVDAHNVLTMRLTLPPEKYKGPAIIPFFDQLVERMQNIPGVRTAAVASQFPPNVVFTSHAPLRSSHRRRGRERWHGRGRRAAERLHDRESWRVQDARRAAAHGTHLQRRRHRDRARRRRRERIVRAAVLSESGRVTDRPAHRRRRSQSSLAHHRRHRRRHARARLDARAAARAVRAREADAAVLESAVPDRANRRRTARDAAGHPARDCVDRS